MWTPTVARNVLHGNLLNSRVTTNSKLHCVYRDLYSLSAIVHRIAVGADSDRDPQSLSAKVEGVAANPWRASLPSLARRAVLADFRLFSSTQQRAWHRGQ